jgi:hypothetical protein
MWLHLKVFTLLDDDDDDDDDLLNSTVLTN